MIFKLKRQLSFYFKKNMLWLIIVSVIFCVGIYVGVISVKGNEITELGLDNVTLSKSEIIYASFIKNSKFLVWVSVCAFSVIGLPAILYLVYAKGMTLGSSVFLMLSLKQGSKAITVLSMVPQMFFLIMSFVFLSQFGICFSVELFKKAFGVRGERSNLSDKIVTFALNIIFSCVCIFLCALIESELKLNIT